MKQPKIKVSLKVVLMALLMLYFGFGVIRYAHFSPPQEFGEIVPLDANLYEGSLIVEKAGGSKHEGVRRSNDINKTLQILNYYRGLKLSRTLSSDYDKSYYYDISLPVKQGPNISVRFYKDGYLSMEKGGEINYYRVWMGKSTLTIWTECSTPWKRQAQPCSENWSFPCRWN